MENQINWRDTFNLIESKFPQVKRLGTVELANMLQAGDSSKTPILLDTRAIEEFRVSRLSGAFRVSSRDEAIDVINGIVGSRPIVLYCSVGYRSSNLAQQLMNAGYSHVYNLEGSIFKWANEERRVEGPDGPTHLVHPFDRTWGSLLDQQHWPPGF